MSETTENVSALSDDIGGLAGSVLSLSERAVALERALAAAERELAGVRKVEAWRQIKGNNVQSIAGARWVAWRSTDTLYETVGFFDTIAALGHALSPEVPDTPREATGGR